MSPLITFVVIAALLVLYHFIDAYEYVLDAVALVLDTADLVVYYVTSGYYVMSGYTPFLWRLLSSRVSLFLLGGLIAFLWFQSSCNILQGLLVEAVETKESVEDELVNRKLSAEESQRLNKELQARNEQLQKEKKHISEMKTYGDKNLIQSYKIIKNLKMELLVAEEANRIFTDPQLKAAFSMEKSVKREKWWLTPSRKTKQSNKTPNYVDCDWESDSTESEVDMLQDSLKAKTALLQQAQKEISGLKESLAVKEACLQKTQADTLLHGQTENLVNEEKFKALNKQIESLTNEMKDRQMRFRQMEESLASKDKSLQDAAAENLDLSDQVEDFKAAQAEASNLEEALASKDSQLQEAAATNMDLSDQVEALKAAQAEASTLEATKLESQRCDIERLNKQVLELQRAHASRETELTDTLSNAMVVDNVTVETQSKEIAGLQEQIRQLQAALDDASRSPNDARLEGEEMDLEVHECDHGQCDSQIAKLNAIVSSQEKQISALAIQLQEQEFRTRSPQTATTAGAPVTTADSLEPMRLELAKLQKEKADKTALANITIRELKTSLRANESKLKEVVAELQVEKVAAATRVESTIRERTAETKKALEDMRKDRDRCRTNNATLLKRAAEVEAALAECRRQLGQSVT